MSSGDVGGPEASPRVIAVVTAACWRVGPASSTALLGYSDGAIVAAPTGVQRTDLVRHSCVAGPFHLAGWIPEAIDAANEPPAFFATIYGEVSPDGIDHFPVVVDEMARAHVEGPTLIVDDLRDVTCRALVMVSDDDEVTLEHAVEFYRALPHGELTVVPSSSHRHLVEKPQLCHEIPLDILNNEPANTFAPVRRRPPQPPASPATPGGIGPVDDHRRRADLPRSVARDAFLGQSRNLGNRSVRAKRPILPLGNPSPPPDPARLRSRAQSKRRPPIDR